MANEQEKELESILSRLERKDRERVLAEKDKNEQLALANRLYKTQANTTRDIYNSLTGIVGELSKERSVRTQINRSSRELLGISNKLLNYEQGIEKFSSKQLKKEKEKAEVNLANLERLKGIGDYGRLQQKNVDGILGLQEKFLAQLKFATEEAKAIETSLGLSGGLLRAIVKTDGLSEFASLFKIDEAVESMEEFAKKQIEAVKTSPEFAGQYEEAQKELAKTSDEIIDLTNKINTAGGDTKENRELLLELQDKEQKQLTKIAKLNRDAAKAATGFVGKLQTMLHGLDESLSNLADSLLDPAVIFGGLIKAAGGVNKQVVGLSKSLALSYDESQDLREEFSTISNNAEDTFVTTKKLLQAQMQFNEILGLQGRITHENARTFAELTERLGIAAESAAKLQLFAEATGANFEQQKLDSYEIAQSVSSQFGIQLNIKQVMDEVGKAGAYALIQNQGSVKALTEAVSMAKALGLELSEVNGIASQLLDFESSIASELEAELLTGRSINLERARFAALTNDQKTLMEEINREMGDFSDFQNMNVIQQQAFAKSLGLNVNQLSDMLLLEQYRGRNQAEITAEAGDEVAKRVEMLTTQERFTNAVEKMQDVFVNLVEGPLGNMAEIMSLILGNVYGLSATLGVIGGVRLIRMIAGFQKLAVTMRAMRIASQGTAIGTAITYALANPLTALVGVAAAAAAVGGISKLISDASTADDLVSPGYGSRMLMSPEGTIALNNKDTVIAGTNLGGGSTTKSSSTDMKETNMLLKAILNKEGTVQIDSSNAGRAFTMGTYRMQ